ncbi:MAG TPA: hypothetical protein VFM50_15925 [Nocardioidaceae bacterium]|jgi:hypothetical protein|nr:hypothetical protein [Nocardioidaceae bacterium]
MSGQQQTDQQQRGQAHVRQGGRRLSHLLGMRIRFADGRDGDEVIDVRLSSTGTRVGHLEQLGAVGLLVGKSRPGTLFGYDRDPRMGPWLIRAILRRVHRHTGYLEWSDVETVDWDAGVLRVRVTELRDIPEEYAGDSGGR